MPRLKGFVGTSTIKKTEVTIELRLPTRPVHSRRNVEPLPGVGHLDNGEPIAKTNVFRSVLCYGGVVAF